MNKYFRHENITKILPSHIMKLSLILNLAALLFMIITCLSIILNKTAEIPFNKF